MQIVCGRACTEEAVWREAVMGGDGYNKLEHKGKDKIQIMRTKRYGLKAKRYDRRFLPMLWIGLALWLGSMLGHAVMEWTGNGLAGQETLMDMGKWMFQSSPVVTLLLLCLFQPILEEFAFRLWGAGKKWMTIVCLVLMTGFAVSEIGWWGVLFVAAFVFVWLSVNNRFIQMWINAIVSSVCFALCHLSGYGGFSLGMLLGMVDIFGLALVLCWLAINFSVWLAALLHVLNNSLAILIPLLFLPDSVSLPCHAGSYGGQKYEYAIAMEPLKPFADNAALVDGSDKLNELDSATTEFYLAGEPAEIACQLARQLPDNPRYTYFDWQPKGDRLEERVLFRVNDIVPGTLRYDMLLKEYLNLAETFCDEPLVFDTTEVMLKSIWLIYDDGREVMLTQDCEDFYAAVSRIQSSNPGFRSDMRVTEYEMTQDSVPLPYEYCIERDSPLNAAMGSVNEMMDKLSGFRIEYRDAKPATLIVIK